MHGCDPRRRGSGGGIAGSIALLAVAATLVIGCASSSRRDARAELGAQDYEPIAPARYEPPAAEASGPATPGRAPGETVDASGDPVIGSVEAEPIRASAVLDGLDERLAELGRTLPRSAFRARARPLIELELRQVLRDRLLLRDAERALNERQQDTLAQWRARMRAQIVESEGGGDPAAAERTVRATYRRTLDEYVDAFTREALLQWRMQNVVDDRIEITDEIVEDEYRRRWDEFHTPEQQTIRLIRTSDPAAADRIDAALAAGTPFREVAGGPDNAGVPGGDVDAPRSMAAGDLVAPLEMAVADLAPGEHSARIPMGASICWIELVRRTPARTVELAEARPALEQALRTEQRTELQAAHVRRLLEEDTYTPPDEMVAAALAVAVARYASSGT